MSEPNPPRDRSRGRGGPRGRGGRSGSQASGRDGSNPSPLGSGDRPASNLRSGSVNPTHFGATSIGSSMGISSSSSTTQAQASPAQTQTGDKRTRDQTSPGSSPSPTSIRHGQPPTGALSPAAASVIRNTIASAAITSATAQTMQRAPGLFQTPQQMMGMGNPFGTPMRSPAGSPFGSAPTTPITPGAFNWAEDELRKIQNSDHPRLRFTPSSDTVVTDENGQQVTIPWQQEPEDTIFRRIARDARWNQFLFHGNYFWREILAQYYLPPGRPVEELDVDNGETVLRGKTKLFEVMKNLKADTLKRFTQHVAQAVKDHPELMVITNTDEVKAFFMTRVFNVNNFNFIWFWMKDYMDFEGSQALGQYYIQNVYAALCNATLLELRARKERPQEAQYYHELRSQLYFQCVCHEHFRLLNKEQFREMHGRAHNDRPTRPMGNEAMAMFGSMPPPPPPSATASTPGTYTSPSAAPRGRDGPSASGYPPL